MSLNWDITRVKGDPKEWTPEQNDSTTVIIWATMVIGMGEITEANAQDFWLRLDMYPKVTGGWTPAVTPADVRRLIGLAPQQFRAPGNVAVDDLVTYLGWLHGLSPARVAERASDLVLMSS